MASVNSPIRRLIKPLLHKAFGERAYFWFHTFGKIRDIKLRLVEEDEMDLLPRLVNPTDQVIDIGANFAYYTTRLAALCPQGEVHAFEPIPSTFRICRNIVRYFGFKNVKLHENGVGAENAVMSFEVPLQEIGTPSAGQAHLGGRNNDFPEAKTHYPFARMQKFNCQVIALDHPEWASQFQSVTFIKIDIEGAELFALKGMEKLLRRDQPALLIEVCPYFLRGFGISEGELKDYVLGLGYNFYRYRKSSGKLTALGEEKFEEGNYFLLHQAKKSTYADLMEAQ